MFAVDVVLRIRPEAYDATFDALSIDISEILVRLNQWQGKVDQETAARNTEITRLGGTE